MEWFCFYYVFFSPKAQFTCYLQRKTVLSIIMYDFFTFLEYYVFFYKKKIILN